MEPIVGQVLEGRFMLHRVLGAGATSIVYHATDVQSGSEVALKIIAEDATDADAFERELAALRAVEHPNIVATDSAGVMADGTRFISFAYVHGATLDEVARRRRVPWRTVAHVCRQVLGALAVAHERGVIHRDIKPQNILIYSRSGDPWAVKLLDFGVARPRYGRDVADEQIAASGGRVGTPDFMSPEQMVAKSLGTQSDLFSLALVAIWAAYGDEQRAAAQRYGVLRYQGHQAEMPQLQPDAFGQWLSRMLAGLPANRFSSARQADRALEPVIRADEDSSQVMAAVGATSRRSGRLGNVILVIALLLVLAAIAVATRRVLGKKKTSTAPTVPVEYVAPDELDIPRNSRPQPMPQ